VVSSLNPAENVIVRIPVLRIPGSQIMPTQAAAGISVLRFLLKSKLSNNI
jgi:hypothetical protein